MTAPANGISGITIEASDVRVLILRTLGHAGLMVAEEVSEVAIGTLHAIMLSRTSTGETVLMTKLTHLSLVVVELSGNTESLASRI